MAEPQRQAELFPHGAARSDVVLVNDRVSVRTCGGHRVVLVSGIVQAQYTLDDAMSEAHAMVSLVEQGWADQNDVARVFGYSVRTLRRYQERFVDGGLQALARRGGYPKGRPRLASSRVRLVERLKAEGCSNRAIAHQLGVSEVAIRKLLRRIGWQERPAAQLEITSLGANSNLSAFPIKPSETRGNEPVASADPNLSAFRAAADPTPAKSLDTDPSNRHMDRLFASLGLLDDAEPVFRSGVRVPRAGVLLALPALTESGIFDCAERVYGSIGPAFYGLRTTFIALLLMALLRIKRAEGLKEHCPIDLGRILGLDRAPEVKTLRRKLSRLAGIGRATDLGRELATRRIAARGSVLGFLYVDGHVRVYHGKHSIPKTHAARLRLPMPATSDYWVNDAKGEPLFVVTANANAGMVKMLPVVLAEMRPLLGDRRLTVVFDRGGFSPKLFQKLIDDGFDILTYRKGRIKSLPFKRFRKLTQYIDGRLVEYELADQEVRLLGGKLRLRQVTRLCESGHQTPILTSRRDLSAVEVAFRMFERWRQENFFKYLREEYALDALVDYQIEPDDPLREVPNPTWKSIDKKLRKARAELQKLQTYHYALQAVTDAEVLAQLDTLPHDLARQVEVAKKRCSNLQAKRNATPKRVAVANVVQGPVVKLATERKHLTNLIKMVAYQAESDLVTLVTPHYKRAEDEGRTLIQSALASAADIEVTSNELRIVIAPLSSAHRTRAIAAICENLSARNVVFPGTQLTLRFSVAAPV